MKFIFNLLMMFIVYNGYSQNTEKSKRRNITTFPNGDEAITIIENSDRNVIRLTRTEDYNRYEMLDLSNHEAVHRPSKKREIIVMDGAGDKQRSYTIRSANTEAIDENEEEGPDGSGA